MLSDDDSDPVLHTATVAGRSVRFFKAPGDELPWCCHGDLCGLAGLSVDDQDRAINHVRPEAEREMGAIKVPEGDGIAISHVLACGFLGHLIGEGLLAPTVAPEYTRAVEAALAAAHGGHAPPALVENIRAAALAMYPFSEQAS